MRRHRRRESDKSNKAWRLNVLLGAIIVLGLHCFAGISYSQSPDGYYDIYRNNPLPSALTSTLGKYPYTMIYTYNEDIYPEDGAIAHTGSSVSSQNASDPQLYQHVFAYSVDDVDTKYQARNKLVNSYTTTIPSPSLSKTNKRILYKDTLSLGGSLILGANSSQGTGFRGVLASLDILMTITDSKTQKEKKILKGSVSLIGLKNGRVRVRTRGKIRRNMLDIIEVADDLYRIDFDDFELKYRTRIALDNEFTIKTTILSTVVNQGYGTGAEVQIYSNLPTDWSSPVVPYFVENNEIPEPASILFLLLGSLGPVKRWNKKRH